MKLPLGFAVLVSEGIRLGWEAEWAVLGSRIWISGLRKINDALTG